MRLWLIAVGWFSLLGQVVLLRELSVAFFGVELLLIVGLGGWLSASATGAFVWRPARPQPASLRAALIAAALLLPLSVAASRGVRVLVGAVPGAFLPLELQLGLCLALVFPLGLLSGAAFQWAARQHGDGGGSLATAYAWESAGALAGGLVATVATLIGVANLDLALLGSFVALAASAWRFGQRPRWLTPSVSAAAALLVASAVSPMDSWLTRLTHPTLVDNRDTAYGRVTITRSAGQLAVFENNALVSDSESVDAEELVHLGALAHPAPRQVLILGGVAENLAALALTHAPLLVDQVELDRTAVETLATFLEPLRHTLADPRVRLHEADPRAWIARGGHYDLVLLAMSEPLSAQANRFFTREFFATAAGALSPGGILALRLRAADTAWSPAMRARNASIAAALAAAFPHTLALPGRSLVLLASGKPLPRAADPLAARLAERRVPAKLISAAYLDYLFTNPRFAEVAAALAAPVAMNTDDQPACYRYTMALWLTQFWPRLSRTLDAPPWPPWAPWLVGAGLTGLALLCRRSTRARRLSLAFAAGFVGMVLEATVLLAYQVSRGALYRDLGLLLTAFMAGLCLGAVSAASLRVRLPGAAGARWLGLGSVTLLGLCAAWLVVLPHAHGGVALWLNATTMVLAGAGVAGLFAVSSFLAPLGEQRVASTYAADLGGGAVGALAGGLVFIPLLGLSGSGKIALGAAMLAALLL